MSSGGSSVCVDVVLESNPSHQHCTECKVEQSLIGYGKNNKDWGESKEDDDQSVEVVIIWMEAV